MIKKDIIKIDCDNGPDMNEAPSYAYDPFYDLGVITKIIDRPDSILFQFRNKFFLLDGVEVEQPDPATGYNGSIYADNIIYSNQAGMWLVDDPKEESRILGNLYQYLTKRR